jgi:tRNA (guanine9-N1)-methyltransferase
VYIIGGIVDHNRLKKITLEYAESKKIVTKRLPMHNVKLKASVHFAVNHVWEWMLKGYNGMDWGEALKSIIPQRKL